MLFYFKSRVCEKHLQAESQCKHPAQIVISIYYFIQMKVAEYECKLQVCHQVKLECQLECQGCQTLFSLIGPGEVAKRRCQLGEYKMSRLKAL